MLRASQIEQKVCPNLPGHAVMSVWVSWLFVAFFLYFPIQFLFRSYKVIPRTLVMPSDTHSSGPWENEVRCNKSSPRLWIVWEPPSIEFVEDTQTTVLQILTAIWKYGFCLLVAARKKNPVCSAVPRGGSKIKVNRIHLPLICPCHVCQKQWQLSWNAQQGYSR